MLIVWTMIGQDDRYTEHLDNRSKHTRPNIVDVHSIGTMENDVDYSKKSMDYGLQALDACGRQVDILGVLELACRDLGKIGTAAVDAQTVVLVHARVDILAVHFHTTLHSGESPNPYYRNDFHCIKRWLIIPSKCLCPDECAIYS